MREAAADERARAERPMVVRAATGDLVAIVTPPAPAAPAAGLGVVHLTRPRSHRNRTWVLGARRLAARGFTACRFDYHGNGDSGGENAFLDPSAPCREDLRAVLDALRERHGVSRFVLTGNCFDARTALAALLDAPGAIAGVAFLSAPVMPLEVMDGLRTSTGEWGGVWQAVNNPANWKRLADPSLWRNVEARLRGVVGRAVPGAPDEANAGGPALDPGFVAAFDALVASKARALFLYGEEDQELLTFQPVMERMLPALDAGARERIRVEIWPGEVHDGFNRLDRQREIVDRVLEWVESFHPAAPADAARGVPAERA